MVVNVGNLFFSTAVLFSFVWITRLLLVFIVVESIVLLFVDFVVVALFQVWTI